MRKLLMAIGFTMTLSIGLVSNAFAGPCPLGYSQCGNYCCRG